MIRHVVVQERAEQDIHHIFAWLYQRSPKGAESWLSELEFAKSQLAESAEIYSLSPEGERLQLEIRQAFFKTAHGSRYRILFDIHHSTVHILRVRGPGQALLRRKDIP
ncbi:MAG: type II toxin-antitoxin system RelE/ParE family toxin [Fimbriiglobus sp.]